MRCICAQGKKLNVKVRAGMLGLDLLHRSSRLHHKMTAVLAINEPHVGMLLLYYSVIT